MTPQFHLQERSFFREGKDSEFGPAARVERVSEVANFCGMDRLLVVDDLLSDSIVGCRGVILRNAGGKVLDSQVPETEGEPSATLCV